MLFDIEFTHPSSVGIEVICNCKDVKFNSTGVFSGGILIASYDHERGVWKGAESGDSFTDVKVVSSPDNE